ncbi:MAG TPA: ABC transporter permease, partial [Alphaproteobacteria bacterium]
MTDFESVRIALRALRVNTLRSALTMLGIIIGVAAVVTMVSVGRGAHVQVAEQIRSLGTNLLTVSPGAARQGGVRLESGSRRNLTESDARAIRAEVAAVEVAAPAVRGKAQIVQGNRNWSTSVFGTEPDYFLARDWGIGAGRMFTVQDVASGAKVALIGDTVAEALFGGADPLGRTVRIANVPFTVAGVLAKKGPTGSGRDQDDAVFVPISAAKLRLQLGSAVDRDAVDYIMVKLASVDAMATAQADIRALLRQRHRLRADADDDFAVYDPTAEMQAYQEATRTFTLLVGAIASVSLLVGGISIMNI